MEGNDLNRFSDKNAIKTITNLSSRMSKSKKNLVYLYGNVTGTTTTIDNCDVEFMAWSKKGAVADISTTSTFPIQVKGFSK